MKHRVYISGPISGYSLAERFTAFEKAELFLSELGYEVFNPMKNGLPAEAPTHKHMQRDLAELTREDKPYDTIFLLRRWTHSAGCRVELSAATSIGMKVMFEEYPFKIIGFE